MLSLETRSHTTCPVKKLFTVSNLYTPNPETSNPKPLKPNPATLHPDETLPPRALNILSSSGSVSLSPCNRRRRLRVQGLGKVSSLGFRTRLTVRIPGPWGLVLRTVACVKVPIDPWHNGISSRGTQHKLYSSEKLCSITFWSVDLWKATRPAVKKSAEVYESHASLFRV